MSAESPTGSDVSRGMRSVYASIKLGRLNQIRMDSDMHGVAAAHSSIRLTVMGANDDCNHDDANKHQEMIVADSRLFVRTCMRVDMCADMRMDRCIDLSRIFCRAASALAE